MGRKGGEGFRKGFFLYNKKKRIIKESFVVRVSKKTLRGVWV